MSPGLIFSVGAVLLWAGSYWAAISIEARRIRRRARYGRWEQ